MTKQEQRKAVLAARRALSPEVRAEASAAICAQLLELPQLWQADVVLSYRALPEEVDLTAVHAGLSEQGIKLLFPVSLPHGRMEAWEPEGWKQGPYGIWEPDRESSRQAKPEVIDLVLVPCVAFDAAKRRLGHGAGYYDRYLPLCPQAMKVAVAFEAQHLEQVVCDEYDQRMDAVVTEQGLYQ